MGRRGPKPKPTALRLLEGNPGRLPINENEPVTRGRARCPKYLRPAAKAVFRRIVNALPEGFYSPAEERLLAAYAEAALDHRLATEQLAEAPKEFQLLMPNGAKSPLVGIRNEAARLMAMLGTRLGLSPADRAGLKAPKQQIPEGSKWKGLIG